MVSLSRALVLFTLLFCFYEVKGQNEFFHKFNVEFSFNTINGQEIKEGNYSTVNNDGTAFGIGLRYDIQKNWFAGATYQRGQVFSIDLQKDYRIGNLIFNGGRSFKMFESGKLWIKVNYALIAEPNYWSLIVFPPGRDPIAQHNYSGNVTWHHYGGGLEYSHQVGKGIYLGGSGDYFSAFNSDSQSLIFSLLIRFRLKNQP